jgi:colicin import membrane protein
VAKAVAKPDPKPEPKPPIKPDIPLKEDKKLKEPAKKEEPKTKEAPRKEDPKAKEQPRKEEPIPKDPPRKEEPKAKEPKTKEPKTKEPKTKEPRPEPERRPSFDDELKRDQKQLQQQKAAQEQLARADAEARQLRQLAAEQAGAERKRGLAEYVDKVRGKIRGNISLPPGIQGNPQAEFEVTQLPTGEVLDVKLRRSSGNPALDAAVERAIRKSSPLPKPANPDLFERVLKIPYKPRDD